MNHVAHTHRGRAAAIARALAVASLVVSVAAGCRSSPLEAECAPDRPCVDPGDACLTITCTTDGRCARRPVADGVACGAPSDCVTAHACLGGACTEVAATDGVECAPATPCRDPGRCRAGACEQPPARDGADPIWVVPAQGGSSAALSPLAVDGAGNFYWQECPNLVDCSRAALVSVDGAGRPRFRVPVGGGSVSMIAGDLVVRAGGCYGGGAGGSGEGERGRS